MQLDVSIIRRWGLALMLQPYVFCSDTCSVHTLSRNIMDDTVFLLTQHNVSETDITTTSGKVVYRVVASRNEFNVPVTNVIDSNGVELARLEQGFGSPDRVKYGDKAVTTITKWMKKSRMPFKK